MRMISMVCGVVATAALCSGCLQKEVAQTIYISPSGVVWSVIERDVRSDRATPADRTLEERDYVLGVDTETHGVAQALRQLGALSVATTWLRRERPYSVMTEARFADVRQVAVAILRDAGAQGDATLLRDGCLTRFNLRVRAGPRSPAGRWPRDGRALDRSRQLPLRADEGRCSCSVMVSRSATKERWPCPTRPKRPRMGLSALPSPGRMRGAW